jgi:hypothetical protein
MELHGCRLDHLAASLARYSAEHATALGSVRRQYPAVSWDDVSRSLAESLEAGVCDSEWTHRIVELFGERSWRYGSLFTRFDDQTGARAWGEQYLWAMLTQRSFSGVTPYTGLTWGWLRYEEICRLARWAEQRAIPLDPLYSDIDHALQQAIEHRSDIIAFTPSYTVS